MYININKCGVKDYNLGPQYLTKRLNMMQESDCAYIAGLFDGEGSINITRKPEKKKDMMVKDIEFQIV